MKHADQSLPRRRPGCWATRRSWRRSPRPWPSGIRRAAPAAGRAPRPRWCCVCWCSSTCATGVTVLEREVRANLVYRDFTRVGGTKMPDAKTMGRWGVAVGPVVVKQIHERIVQIARDHRVAQGRRMRVDTTVVETNIHYPTDSSLLGDGVRVLTRTMKKITGISGGAGAKLRDRSRSVKWRVLEIARAARAKGRQSGEKLAQAYRRLLEA